MLSGNDVLLSGQQKVSFPVLEKDQFGQIGNSFGVLESFTIDIRKNNAEDNFIIMSSTEITVELLISQIKISWNLALNYINHSLRRIKSCHKVIIHFGKRLGNYSGSSFGAALTINFIEELIKFYNLSFLISIKKI